MYISVEIIGIVGILLLMGGILLGIALNLMKMKGNSSPQVRCESSSKLKLMIVIFALLSLPLIIIISSLILK